MTIIEIRLLAIGGLLALMLLFLLVARLGSVIAESLAARAARSGERTALPRSTNATGSTSHAVLTRQALWRLRC